MKKKEMKKPKNIVITGRKGNGMSYSTFEILGKRDWYKPMQKELLEKIEACRWKMRQRKYNITIDGYNIRTNADFNRVDMSKSERRKHHRKIKLEKKDIVREEKTLSSVS